MGLGTSSPPSQPALPGQRVLPAWHGAGLPASELGAPLRLSREETERASKGLRKQKHLEDPWVGFGCAKTSELNAGAGIGLCSWPLLGFWLPWGAGGGVWVPLLAVGIWSSKKSLLFLVLPCCSVGGGSCLALPWHRGSQQLLTDGSAPPSGRPRCCSQEAHPGLCLLVSARNRQEGEAPWLGGCFGARGKGEPPPSCRCSLPLTRRLCAPLPGGHRVLAPWSLSRGEGILCPPRSQGAAIQRGPAMLPSFLLAGGAGSSAVPAPGALAEVPRASQCSGVGQLHTEPFVPTAWARGHLRALLGGFGTEGSCAHSLQAGTAFRRNPSSHGLGTKAVPGCGWHCPLTTAGRGRAAGRCVGEEGRAGSSQMGFNRR